MITIIKFLKIFKKGLQFLETYANINLRNIKSGRRQVLALPVCPTPSKIDAQRTGVSKAPDRGAIIPRCLFYSQPGEVTQIIFFCGLEKVKEFQ